jgi:membrane protein implicated in regulation of membrane protease activity
VAHRTTSTTGGAPARRPGGAWLVVAVLLAIGIVVPLLVPVYAHTTPTLFGFPFYFWFQFALIPVVSALTYVAFRLSLRATESDRATLGLPTDQRPQDRGGDGSPHTTTDGTADQDGGVR